MNKWNLTPRWIDVTLTICKWFMHVMPFVCCSIAMFLTDTMSLGENYLLTAIYGLSLLKLWDLVDSK
jgi:hypothetical protein